MDENRLRFGVGVLVISAIGIGIILTFLFGAFPSVLNRDYAMTVAFKSAEGIGLNTPVVRDGVRIGRVSGIELQPQGGVLVSLAMDSSIPLTHQYIPRIGNGNFVTGDAKLEFVRGTARQLAEAKVDESLINQSFGEGEYLDYGKKSSGLMEMQGDLQDTFETIRTAGESIAAAGESVNQLAMEVRQVIGGADGKLDVLSEEAVKTLEEFQGAMREVRAIVGNPVLKSSIEKTAGELPELLKEARTTLSSTQKTFESFERAGTQFEKVGVAAEDTVKNANDTVITAKETVLKAQDTFAGVGRTVDNLERITEPFANRSEEFANQVMRSLINLEGALAQVESFGQSLNNSDGTLKRFLEDDDIYFQVQRTIANIEQATSRIRPIMDDVRIFTDKIARDPRELGVRGALSKRPSSAGFK